MRGNIVPITWQNNGLTKQQQDKLDELLAVIAQASDQQIGYPATCQLDYSPLYPFLKYPINNIGDPFVSSAFRLHTHQIEREVLETFGQWLHAPSDDFWGYINNGGTEGNMYGVFLARELYPEGMVYFSEDTHYSVSKSLRLLNVRNIMIKSQPNGEIDYEDLKETIFIHRDIPPIVFANIGTTMKGAVDDVKKIKNIMKELAIPNYYIHADAALSGMILPFVIDPQPFDFSAGIDSISVSGHKLMGSPIPCGIVLAHKSNVDRIARSIEYVGTLDTTLSGSRNAITPLFLWYAINTVKYEGFKIMINACLEMAEYTVDCFKRESIKAWRNRNSITVVIPRPAIDVVNKWQLAVSGEIAHIITVPHVKKIHIEAIIKDIVTLKSKG